ncbi:MAG: hypothetical protein ACLUKN_09010 [Bacilli bacterium]
MQREGQTYTLKTTISQAIMNGSCMDVVEIDGASNRSIDEIRQLRDDCQYAPPSAHIKFIL